MKTTKELLSSEVQESSIKNQCSSHQTRFLRCQTRSLQKKKKKSRLNPSLEVFLCLQSKGRKNRLLDCLPKKLSSHQKDYLGHPQLRPPLICLVKPLYQISPSCFQPQHLQGYLIPKSPHLVLQLNFSVKFKPSLWRKQKCRRVEYSHK